MRTKYVLLAIFSMLNLYGYAQHQVSIFAGRGVHSGSYSLSSLASKTDMGTVVGVGYNRKLSSCWGVLTGAELCHYNSSLTGNITDSYAINDGVSELDYRISFNGFEETHKITYLQIPLMAKYTHKLAIINLYASGGIKAGIGVKGAYDVKISRVATTGYNEATNTSYTAPDWMGFGSFPNQSANGTFELAFLLLGSIELGIESPFNNTNAFSVAFYLDYGATNAIKNKPTSKLLDYNQNFPTSGKVDNLLLNSAINSQTAGKNIVDKLHLFTVGIKVAYAIGW